MPTINVPSTEAELQTPSVTLADRDVKGGFLGGLATGVVKEAPDVMEARKKKMKLLAEGNEDASYQAATIDAEKAVREIGERIKSGELTAKQGKIEASFALQRVSRGAGLTMKASNSIRDTFSTIISVYGEEETSTPGEAEIVIPAMGGPARVRGAEHYDPEVTALYQIKTFPKELQGYYFQRYQEDKDAAISEIGRFSDHLRTMFNLRESADIADQRAKLNKATKEDQERTAKDNLNKAQDTITGLFYSIMVKGRQDVSGKVNPQVALSEANMKFDGMILQNQNLIRLAEAANVPIGQFVDSVLGNWRERLTSGVTGVDPLLEKVRNTQELETEMKLKDVSYELGFTPEQRYSLRNSSKFLDAAILEKMKVGTLGASMPKNSREVELESQLIISHGNEVNRRITSYTTKTPEGLHKLVESSVPDFITVAKALSGDAAATKKLKLMDIDSTKRNLDTIISDPSFKQLDPENQSQLQQLHEQINEIYKRM